VCGVESLAADIEIKTLSFIEQLHQLSSLALEFFWPTVDLAKVCATMVEFDWN